MVAEGNGERDRNSSGFHLSASASISRCAKSISFFVQPSPAFGRSRSFGDRISWAKRIIDSTRASADGSTPATSFRWRSTTAPTPYPAGVLQRITKEGICFDTRLAVRLEIVQLVEVQIRDLANRSKARMSNGWVAGTRAFSKSSSVTTTYCPFAYS